MGDARISSLPISYSGHEEYADKEHQRSVLSGYYAVLGRPIEDSDVFLIICFEISKAVINRSDSH